MSPSPGPPKNPINRAERPDSVTPSAVARPHAPRPAPPAPSALFPTSSRPSGEGPSPSTLAKKSHTSDARMSVARVSSASAVASSASSQIAARERKKAAARASAEAEAAAAAEAASRTGEDLNEAEMSELSELVQLSAPEEALGATLLAKRKEATRGVRAKSLTAAGTEASLSQVPFWARSVPLHSFFELYVCARVYDDSSADLFVLCRLWARSAWLPSS